MNMKKLYSLMLLVSVAMAVMGQESARSLSKRVLGAKLAAQVSFEVKADTDDYFCIEPREGGVLISGNNDNSLCMGLNHYLKHCAKVHVSWLEEQPTELPKHLPVPEKRIYRKALVKERFFLNYCTFGYTMPWWGWDQWEHFIDWMALNGITMPLAITGQEAVWQAVWRELGMTDEEIRSYFSGPAHLPWHRMANLDGFGGPLPQSWIDGQKALQQQIVARERELGMTPVLPAFAGHVPQQVKDRFPDADIQQLDGWCGLAPTYFLNATDSLFAVIQRAYLEKQTQLFGTDHVYGCDPFNEMNPPSYDPEYLAAVSRNIYGSLQSVDPQARWLQMSWVFYYKRKQWTPERLKAYLDAVPQGRMLLLDYFCENTEVWRASDAFHGQPFVWCYLGNFGGNTMLVGDIYRLEEKLNKALAENPGGNLEGIGSTLESFDCSPQIYEYLFERAWGPLSVYEWTDMWADTRVGHRSALVRNDWHTLVDKIYKDWSFYGLGTQLVARPSFDGHGTYYTKPEYSYDNELLFNTWRSLYLHLDQRSDRYRYDLVNLGSQFLGNLFTEVRDRFTVAYRHRNVSMMRQEAETANWVLEQTDRLLSSHESFLMGRWIDDARSMGKDKSEKDYYEQQARTLLTIWGGPVLNDYANRMWGGLVKDYYARRWNLFFDMAVAAVEQGDTLDMKAFDDTLSRFEHEWVERRDKLPSKAKGSTDKICWEIMTDYPHNVGRLLYDNNVRKFPQSTLQDIYKNAFQDCFGPNHLVLDSAQCAEGIRTETGWLSTNDTNPLVDVTGTEGNYFRVNLSLVRDGVIPLEVLVHAVMRSSQVKPRMSVSDWACHWDMMHANMPKEVRMLPDYARDSANIADNLSRGVYVMHHSHRFNEAYNYHYRLVESHVFFEEIWPRLNMIINK